MVQSAARVYSRYGSLLGRTLAIALLDTSVIQNASTQESTSVRLLNLLPAHLGILSQNSKILVLEIRSSGQGWNFQKASTRQDGNGGERTTVIIYTPTIIHTIIHTTGIIHNIIVWL